ncbi:MAG: glycosyltransferase [Alphaproteobacteria bacterium]|jgi:exo-beta-1,3-glucanase (GH17 family)/cellulose synthase/poly-beta-1,6-N-acetylglucosamine synthase-like glycosyltransferase|nr:glycosyltransferase [Alphaproteobacteria bacterium]
MRSAKNIALVLLIVFVANLAIWGAVNQGAMQRPWGGKINSLSYSAWQSGNESSRLDDATVDADMKLLSEQANAIRLYGLSDGLDRIVPIAGKYDLKVLLGAWISPDAKANQEEVDHLVRVTRANPNVKLALVGNESILRTDVTTQQLIEYIEKAKRQLPIPVSTAEPWHVWLDHPELARSVDFIAVHILPYWEGVDIYGALGYVDYRIKQLKAAYPDKHILLGEVGWPSEGQWIKGAEPSRINQAKFIREFLNYASEMRLDYSIVEALDTPWKRGIEGTVGAHWGIWDSSRQVKFEMSGIVRESTHWLWGCTIAFVLALFPIQWFVRKRDDLRRGGLIFYALLIQAVSSLLVWAILVATAEKIINANTIAWVVLIGFQVVLLALLLVDGLELTEVLWANRRRAFQPIEKEPSPDAPMVSIHVPCYNEPPHMVIETLNALAQMEYPNFEVLVVDNNTKDEEVWKPLQEHCEKLGSRFRFFHLPKWPGFKAGALNYALTQTDKNAQIVGVIDSDYIVTPNWLRATIPYFDKEDVAIVQAPQDYRDGGESLFKRMCFWEYAGFFHIGMVQRNERNAIIQHGTMTLIRKKILQSVKGWAEWCICEDAELGLRLFENGFEAVYLEHSFGRGLIPDSFGGYKTQRFRWAYGAVQILKKHWNELSENKGIDGKRLTAGQRYHFITGWLPWFADAAHMVFVSAAILWSILILLHWVEFPPTVFLVPTLSVFVFKVLAGQWLYRVRVKCGWKDRLGAALAGMALTHAVGRAVWQGLFTSGKPFIRTPKCDDKPAATQAFLMAREEIVLLVLLLIAAASILITFRPSNHNAVLWSGMLLVQTLPYWAALITSMINTMGKKEELIPQTQAQAPT